MVSHRGASVVGFLTLMDGQSVERSYRRAGRRLRRRVVIAIEAAVRSSREEDGRGLWSGSCA